MKTSSQHPARLSRSQALLDLYAQWRDLSEEEGGAIRGGEWKRVGSCQAAKYALRDLIDEIWDQFRAETIQKEGDRHDMEKRLRPVISELLALEERNAEWLMAQRQKAAAQEQELRQSSRMIQRIHRAYQCGVGDL